MSAGCARRSEQHDRRLEMPVKHEPQVQMLVEQPYVAIRRQVTIGVPAAVDSAFPELLPRAGRPARYGQALVSVSVVKHSSASTHVASSGARNQIGRAHV